MSDIIPEGAGNALTKKIGPLPGIAWVALIAGVVWLVYLWRKRGAAAGNSGAVAVSTPAAVGFSSAGPMPGTGTYNGQVNTLPVGQAAVSTNANWAKTVTDFLVGTGNYSGTDVSNALSKYLSGQQLGDAERAIIDTAVKQFQTPPEGVVQTATDTPLAQKFTRFISYIDDPTLYGITASGQQVGLTYAQYLALGKPDFERSMMSSGVAHAAGIGAPAGNRYTMVAGDTVDSLAAKFYGNSDVHKIIAANPGSPFTPGSVLVIPN